ncbi:hypothetical protein [Cytobacillus massiliigabonensis]|uniref:hypothetical protein n=1 Tax=Cytobacillus massiliigabonensis TaxID=1871011 RepID=UPI0015E108EB|nr:hypothetical protein [Cytobacillus massiliigabonensis]
MFNENSVVVKVWFTAVLAGTYKYSDVPNLSNLREEVGKKLTQIGYDITEPAGV